MSETKNHGFLPLRLLEFYSGIGGVRYGMERSSFPFIPVGAVDINTVVNDIYKFNFGQENHFQRNIQSFRAEEIDKMHPDIVTMSPPCQPFTRLGLKLDAEDPRSQSFLHLLDVYDKLEKKPTYFFLENVAGFESTCARDALVQTLKKCGYIYQEFLLSPSQCGIPNSRTRYYIIAKLLPREFAFPASNQVLSEWPKCEVTISLRYPCLKCETLKEAQTETEPTCTIKHFLEDKPPEYFDDYLLSSRILEKYAMILDIVEEDSKNSCCFTKAYGKYVMATGSVLHPSGTPDVDSVYKQAFQNDGSMSGKSDILRNLKLRNFTPQEVANLMCFPQSFQFPKHIPMSQRYKALGNSVNVFVVSRLLTLLLSEK